MSIIAENEDIKALLLKNGIDVESVADIHPIRVQPSRVLGHIYARLGRKHYTHTKLKNVKISYYLYDDIGIFVPHTVVSKFGNH